MKKTIKIEYLFLDIHTCDRCIGTGQILDEVVAEITPALELAGYQVDYQKIEMSTIQLAVQYHFLSSPTVRVNGQDICTSVKESDCGCCGNISGTDVDCRIFEYEGKSYEVPPKAMLAEAILQGVFAPAGKQSHSGYTLPDNLKSFFNGKEQKNGSCSCTDGCC